MAALSSRKNITSLCCHMKTAGEFLFRCELCPRRCGADRVSGKTGFCGAGAEAEVFRYGPHNGEEPPISGEKGSGTVFFSRCTMKCIYCQNHPWSQDGAGRKYDVWQLADIFAGLKREGCHNWNLVSPTPWLPLIREAMDLAAEEGGRLPVVYNTSGFERPEMLEEFKDLGDIYLTDLRYSRSETARDASCAENYVAAARAALLNMWRMAGPLKTRAGIAVSGVICRILVLPGREEEAVESLRWLAETVGTDISLSLMSQYVPLYKARSSRPWDRPVTDDEYAVVCGEAERLGFETGWIQEFGMAGAELIGAEMKSVEKCD